MGVHLDGIQAIVRFVSKLDKHDVWKLLDWCKQIVVLGLYTSHANKCVHLKKTDQ